MQTLNSDEIPAFAGMTIIYCFVVSRDIPNMIRGNWIKRTRLPHSLWSLAMTLFPDFFVYCLLFIVIYFVSQN